MQRLAAIVVCGAVLCASDAFVQESHAQQNYHWDAFWHRQHQDYHRMNAFPEPFNHADRAATREPFCRMIAKGWQLQNTLSAYHFDANTNQLTRAGEEKVRWIVHRAPEQHRSVFVMRGYNRDETATRIDSVQQTVAKLLPEGRMPPVMETASEPMGRPGEFVDDAFRKSFSAAPAPVLPAASGGGGSE